MEAARSSGGGSGESLAETLRFEEEIQSLIHPGLDPPPSSAAAAAGSSFTALLGLPANQAVELLHDPVTPRDPWRLSLPFAPTFPSNAALVERAARLSVFAAEASPDTSPSPAPKTEPADSAPAPPPPPLPQRPAKRKDAEKHKPKGPSKRSRSAEEKPAEDGGADKLPYVHVRARRGQATDSHSLAERARREKINARMKLLQELVPGCSKISGTALVLDEIINHVQSLQRQVEFLSMRLAAVNPRIDFGSNLDESFLSAEQCGQAVASDGTQPLWSSDVTINGGGRRQLHGQQIWHADLVQPPSTPLQQQQQRHPHHQQGHIFINPGASLFAYGSLNPVSLHSNHLKTEL